MNILNETLATIQTELKAKKSSYNAFGKYYFRKAEDILEAVKPFLLKHQVSVRIKEDIISETPVPTIQSTAILSDGENQITATAIVGVDLNQKGMQTAQQFGAASSYGKKYALGNLFLIDDTADADSTNGQGKAAALVNKAKPVMSKDQLNKAIDFVQKGGAITAIESKYNVTSDQLEALKVVATHE
jgi:hypothetical protein